MINKYTLAAIGFGAGFVAYCIYFDRKRRNDPNFRLMLKEKRLKESKHDNDQIYPDLSDDIGVQNFFVSEMQLGQQLLAEGDIENGTEHIAFAVLVSPDKEELLSFLRAQLPDLVFQAILQKFPSCGEKLLKAAKLRPTEENSFKIEPERKVFINQDEFIIEEEEEEEEDVELDD
jgi:import receptor subunit TOM20